MKPDIQTIQNFLETPNLNIPEYQRPYKWTAKNINQLIDDILFFNDKDAYRFGTIVLHDDNKNLNIVDGQQRTISLLLIALAIQANEKLKKYFKSSIVSGWTFTNTISHYNIQTNYKEIERRIKDFDEKTVKFLFEKCEVVIVTLNDISEAFQFFDSQNARGKDLEPHDLLKAFHLREMLNLSESDKLAVVENWENMDSDELIKIFNNYLFRIRNWSKGKSARFFTKSEIDVFKGIKLEDKSPYSYSKMYLITNYYVENYNKEYHRNIDNNKIKYPFQIDQPIINGKRFFEMISYYQKMIERLPEDNSIIKLLNDYKSRHRTGDKYVKNLFDCTLVYYIDKFGEVELDKAIEKIFIWAYTLRLKQHSVQIASMDNYALENQKIYTLIREATSHKDIINMHLDILKEVKSTKTKKLKQKFKDLNYV